MTVLKPLSYYTSYVPGQKGVLEKIQRTYGSCLQNLATHEKLYMMFYLVRELGVVPYESVRDEVKWDCYQMYCDLDTSDQEGMIHALIVYLRSF
ncbi:MAG: hypothetical protein WBF90_35930 [Rivularia sp. (in: cyanobacteria)]